MKVKLDPGAFTPTRAHKTDAGLDLRTPKTRVVPPNSSVVINTGIHIELPHGCYGKIESKSGLNVKHDIVSCGGVIDEGYTGAIVVKLYNFGDEMYTFNEGDKVAQLIIQPYSAPDMELVDCLEDTERGDSGFGSSGR